MGNVIPLRPTKPQLLNIAISLVALTSLVFNPGKLLLSAVFDPILIRDIPAFQKMLAYNFASYWVPATLFYLMLVLTPIGIWLKSTRSIHWSLFIANIILILYLSARVLASTVQGGGVSFLVISYSIVTALPALFLVMFSFVRMIILSIRHRSADTDAEVFYWGQALKGRSWALVSLAVSIPIVFAFYVGYGEGSPFKEARVRMPVFKEKCQIAGDTIHLKRTGAKGILLDRTFSRRFTKIKDGRITGSRGGGFLDGDLLHRYDLPFVELIERSSSQQDDETVTYYRKYERGSKKDTVETPISEYVVHQTSLTDDRDRSFRITGEKVEIYDRKTQELVASSIYFNSIKDWRFCGDAPGGDYTTSAFIARALNLQPRAK